MPLLPFYFSLVPMSINLLYFWRMIRCFLLLYDGWIFETGEVRDRSFKNLS